MNVRVRLFAIARQAAGCDTVEVALPDGATVGRLREELARQVPQLSGLLPHVTFAVGEEYAGDRTVLAEDAEVACIPPVSGG